VARFREETLSVAGAAVRVLRAGTTDGTDVPILYLHGAGGIDGVSPYMEALAAKRPLIVPEHPGFGDAPDPPWLDNIHDLAYFYLSVLDVLALPRVHLVGMSLGGWIAAEMAVRDQSRLATLTLAGAAGLHVKGVPKGDIFMWTPEERAAHSFHDPALAEAALKHEAAAGPDAARRATRRWRTVALLGWNPRLYDPHLHKWLGRIRVPTHIVWAEHDRILPLAYGREYQRLIPGATLSTIPRAGHLMHVEKPAAFAAAILDFIAGACR
jgi:pimeloyl-ACP methyl ester carboxylesterase